MTNFAVTALIIDRDLTMDCDGIPHILGVSRKDRPWDMGLPGGKVDSNETPDQAVVREVLEETGLTLTKVHPIFSHMEHPYVTITYGTDRYTGTKGDVQTTESGVVRYCSIFELVTGSFKDYNLMLFSHTYPQWRTSLKAMHQFASLMNHISDHQTQYTFDCRTHVCLKVRNIGDLNRISASKIALHLLSEAFGVDGIDLHMDIG